MGTRIPVAAISLSTLLLALGAGGCGGGTGGDAGTARPPAHDWLSVDVASRRATITLTAAYDRRAGGLNLDGTFKGALLFAVPASWSLQVRWINDDAARYYAWLLTPAPGSTDARSPAAGVVHPSGGLAPGERAVFPLKVPRPGLYRISAVTSGHVPAGMWVVLQVTEGGRPYARWLR